MMDEITPSRKVGGIMLAGSVWDAEAEGGVAAWDVASETDHTSAWQNVRQLCRVYGTVYVVGRGCAAGMSVKT